MLLALQPLCHSENDEDGSADCGKLPSDWFNSQHVGLTSPLHSLYFSLLNGCLSSLTSGTKVDLCRKHQNPVTTVSDGDRVSPPPSKKPRLASVCPYQGSNFDLLLQLDDGTQVPASREAVAGAEGTDGVGSGYFRALLRGGFGEAQGGAKDPICIKDVSAGMLLPVLHYLHGCRLSRDAEREGDEGEGRGQCEVLDTLLLEGLGISQKETNDLSVKDFDFQKTSLGEMMMGACRFLVTELQKEMEDLCVSFLLSSSTTAPSRAAAALRDENTEKSASKTDPECLESAEEENLASQTSQLELTGLETENVQVETENQTSLSSGHKTVKSVCCTTADKTPARQKLGLEPKNLIKSSTPAAQDSVSSLAALLPQLYWFSQRYSYPAVGRACLSLLLGCQDCPRPVFSSSLTGDCLRRLAREADCAETLKKDLLYLATAALS